MVTGVFPVAQRLATRPRSRKTLLERRAVGSKKGAATTKAKADARAQELRELLASGLTRDEVVARMGISVGNFYSLRSRLNQP